MGVQNWSGTKGRGGWGGTGESTGEYTGETTGEWTERSKVGLKMAPACAGFLSLAVNADVRSPLAYDGQTLPDLRPSAQDLAKINHDLDDQDVLQRFGSRQRKDHRQIKLGF